LGLGSENNSGVWCVFKVRPCVYSCAGRFTRYTLRLAPHPTLNLTLNILRPTPYALHLTPHTSCTSYSPHPTHPAHPARHIRHMQHLAHPTPNTLHPTHYTLHPTPHTPHPTRYTLHPIPHTPHPTLQAPHPYPRSRMSRTLDRSPIAAAVNSAAVLEKTPRAVVDPSGAGVSAGDGGKFRVGTARPTAPMPSSSMPNGASTPR